ncbi:DUF1638 domain-containing protein [Rhodovibrio salinarum]|uniref:DUF1638 domain-containing protein n=1 Tax=Rhodovibrio salinarum TaxID=1087 RepID=A0A934QJK1_9PROT|nr:DUF1638 domain-containing protein [Rhodovibrio salinarum]MBK1698101.1 DUF1638 domain-containing protein [Rhodovibrio salinarum]
MIDAATGTVHASAGQDRPRTLLIGCGALAREILALIEREGWDHMELTCLPAIWHNTPGKIPGGVREKIRANRDVYDRIFCVYADCGTGGELDRVLEEEGVARLPGPHCYATYAGQGSFAAMAERDPACFYLTDYLVRHFDRLIVEGLGLDRFPELSEMYFGNYTTLVYLAQQDDSALDRQAQAAAARLGLAYRREMTGYGELERELTRVS